MSAESMLVAGESQPYIHIILQEASMQVGQIGRPKKKKASNSASLLGPLAAAAAHGVTYNCVSDKLRT